MIKPSLPNSCRPSFVPAPASARSFLLASLTSLAMLCAAGCGDSGMSASDMAAPVPTGSCSGEQRMVAYEGATHLPIGTPLTFASNPPASGSHYPTWGTWGLHTTPLPRGHYVHNAEHGGIVLLYRCDKPCPDVEAALVAVMNSAPQDATCVAPVRNRIVVTQDALLDVPIAAMAWQQIYRASCVDTDALRAFVAAFYDRGPESLCAQGSVN